MGNIETKEKPKHIVKVPYKPLKYEDVCKLCYKNTNVE